MTEDEACVWLSKRVPRETMQRLEQFANMVVAEAPHQNLISASTIDTLWSRHIVDSAQLLEHAPVSGGWIDLGAGAGFPGLVVAIIGNHRVTLAESRAKRVGFLRAAVAALGLDEGVQIVAGRIETMAPAPFAVISARAFAPLDRLLASSAHLSDRSTRWVLPRGRGAKAELDAARGSWQGDFRVVPSVTDPDAAIIVAENVRRREAGRKAGSAR